MEAVDDKVEEIIGPLDAEFQEVPSRIASLQDEVLTELRALKLSPHSSASTSTDGSGVCDDIPSAIQGAPWESSFRKRVAKMTRDYEKAHRKDGASDAPHELVSSWRSALN